MFALSWRNIWRHRTRSTAAVVAVAVAVWFTLIYFGLVGAVMTGLESNLTESLGHIQIHVKGYRDIREFRQSLIRNAAATRANVAAAAPAADLVAALEVPVLLSGETRARGVLIVGLDQPAALRDRFSEKYLAAGRLPRADEVDAIALGTALARTMEVGLGSTVYAYAPGTEGLGAAAYTVAGLLLLPDPLADARFAYLSLVGAQELAAPDSVSRFELHLPQMARATSDTQLIPVRQSLADTMGAAFDVETWREVNPSLSALERIVGPLVMLFVTFFFILAGLLVVNTIYLSLVERIREFGVITALGANRGKVIRMVLLEGLLLCAAGAAVGLVLGLLSVASLARGFSYPAALADVQAQFGLPRVLYASIMPSQIVITAVFVFATGILAALWPAWVASRLEPVEAIRFVP